MRKENKMSKIEKQDKWSYSKLSTYLQCPMKYTIEYVCGMTEEFNAALHEKRTYGTYVHALLENRLLGSPNTQMDVLEYEEKKLLSKYDQPLVEEEVLMLETLKERAITIFNVVKQDPFLSECEVVKDVNGDPMVEYSFEIPIGKKIFRGFVDFVVRHIPTGRVWLVDAKTVSQKQNELQYEHNMQLPLYMYALQDVTIENGQLLGDTLIGGMIYQISNKELKDPKINKNGSISRSAPGCTWDTYKRVVEANGFAVADYAEMEEKCLSLEDLVIAVPLLYTPKRSKFLWDMASYIMSNPTHTHTPVFNNQCTQRCSHKQVCMELADRGDWSELDTDKIKSILIEFSYIERQSREQEEEEDDRTDTNN